MDSLLPGFIAQLKGKLTKNIYQPATVFVDHFSRLSYMNLQINLTSDNTLKVNNAFESYSRKQGVKIYHYHAENGRFAQNQFSNISKNKDKRYPNVGSMHTSKWDSGENDKGSSVASKEYDPSRQVDI